MRSVKFARVSLCHYDAGMNNTDFYEPTEAEIAAQCAEIRRGWTEREAQTRVLRATMVRYDPARLSDCWLPPTVHVDNDLAAALER
jgi:hypothetical protein